MRSSREKQPTRRSFLRGTALAAGFFVAGCRKRSSLNRVVKVGFVSPKTGAIAAFGEADPFVVGGIRKALANGLVIAGERHPVEILEKDSRSDPNRAAEVASDLIKTENVDLILAACTPDTVNPVADQAEINGVPCITTDAPWQPYFFSRGGNPKEPFDWTYHFFWGADDLVTVYVNLWESLPTNRVVGALWANDTNGIALADQQTGFPPVLKVHGFQLVDPGRFQVTSTDYSAQIVAFKQAGVEIVTGGIPAPAFATFWSQAAQQGFRPKIVTVAKALVMPSEVASIGPRANLLSTEVWWSPYHPFRSSLTGQSSAELCAEFERSTGKQWTAILGFKHALFSVALDVLSRTRDVNRPESIRASILETDYQSIVGRVCWMNGPVRNVSKTPLVGGQWVRGTRHPFELMVVNNQSGNEIPTQAALRPLVFPES